MIHTAREQARALALWLETGDAASEAVAIALGEVPEDTWNAVRQRYARPFECNSVNRTIAKAHELLGRSPREAQSLARLALRMSRNLSHEASDPFLTQGDAWRECAAAHSEVAEYADARDAIGEARACYSRSSASRMNATLLSLIEGRTLFELGERQEALSVVDRASAELLRYGAERKKYVQARIAYASILAAMAQYGAALDVFSEAADFAMNAGDNEMLAYVLSNSGLIAAKLEDYANARQCFESALRLFADLGLASEMPHVRAALVTILRQQGRYNEAVSELFKVRAEFLSLGVPVAAAIASL